ncbi:MAG: TraB/GumN family protein [Ferruginibacter sp.]
MRLILPVIVFFIFFFTPSLSVAQETSAKTLLWRISGNGLQKPSYLYGTMHLKDRRLFFFGDSVYKSMEASEGFAMELDPNAMMDSIFSKIGEADTTTLLRKLLDEKKFKSVSKKLEKKFGMPADKISRKQLIAERENWYYHIQKSDDMNTVVDLYLYNIAHRQGKWVGGIEDVEDQLGIKDELGKDINIMEYVDDNDEGKRKVYLDKMIAVYAAEDIDKIEEMINGSQSQKSRDLLLVNRNIKMASRMDSMSHVRNSFFAIGAAHLPGDAGVISLLKRKGFVVTPVFSSKKIAPEKYTYTAKQIPWIKFLEPDSAYTVELPGKPSDLKVSEDVVKFKVFADLVSSMVYMTGFSLFSSDEKPAALTDKMIKSFLSRGFEKKEERKVSNNGTAGTEMIAVMKNVYYRLQIFPFADKLFVVMAGAEKKENLSSKDAERFFTSFTMNSTLTAKPNTWTNFTDESKAFDISFPKKPGVDKLNLSETAKSIETTTYTALDVANNTYYLVVVNDTKRGFIMNEDSLVFDDKLSYYKQNNIAVSDKREFRFENNSAMSFTAKTNKDGVDYVSKILIICRGNRNYSILAVTEKGREDYPDITQFFRSFKLLPFKEKQWSKNDIHDFTTWSPSSFERQLPDTAGLSVEEAMVQLNESTKLIQFIAHDPYSATSYHVNIHPVSKYYSAKNDSIFLSEQLETYFSDTVSYFAKLHPSHFDSLISKKAITNGKIKGYEIWVKNASESYYKRVRILPHGDSSYHLFTLAPYASITDQKTNKFFEEFRFLNEEMPSTIQKKKTALILADMAGSDSATKAEARSAINITTFDSTDLPLLFTAYLKKYPVDTTQYNTVNEKISNAIGTIHDSSIVSFVMDNYITGTVNSPELKMDMLKMLARQKTRSGTLALKELLLKNLPLTGSANLLINTLTDSLPLSGLLFPEAARFFGDSLLGAGMIRLAVELVDSNLLPKDILLNNVSGIMHTATSQFRQLKKDIDDYPFFSDYIIDVLGKINSKQSVSLLNQFVKITDLYVKQNAVLALLKNNQAAPAVDVQLIAADKGYRTSFYKELKTIGKQALFPPVFLTQQQFAEGYLYNYTSDDDMANPVIRLLGERVASINGIERRFYLYKISFEYDESKETHLAICGPFDINRKKVDLKEDDISIKLFYDEEFKLSSVNKLYEGFITDEKTKAALPANK